MGNLPVYISIVFILTTCLTIYFFYKATNNSIRSVIIILLWLTIQTIVSLKGFYTVTKTMPPRFLLVLLPPILLIAFLFFTVNGRRYIDSLNVKWLTLLHIVRIPVELVLFWLFLHKAVPQLMTFNGRNFDIISGLTAPFIFYFGFLKKTLSRKFILIWSFICLGLLINIVVIAILSAPFIFQQFGFEQPDIAILYFPFVWLPCCIVPLVLLAHLATIRQFLKVN